MNLSYKNFALLVVIILTMLMLSRTFKQPGNSSVSVSYSEFLDMLESENVLQVTIQGDNISGMSARGPFMTFAPKDPELIMLLRSKGVKISVKPEEDSSLLRVFSPWLRCFC